MVEIYWWYPPTWNEIAFFSSKGIPHFPPHNRMTFQIFIIFTLLKPLGCVETLYSHWMDAGWNEKK